MKASALRAKPTLVEVSNDLRADALSNGVIPFQDKDSYVREISRLWRQAQDSFVTIGRYLIEAKRRLQHGEFEAMVASELPFSKTVAYQLRLAADAILSGRLDKEQVPPSYSTVYLLATLDDSALEKARAERLVRPDVRRSEVVAFRSRLNSAAAESEDTRRLRRELAKLEEERARLDDRIREVRAKLESERRGPTNCQGTIIEGTAEPMVDTQ
jgi:hypothetical protein